MKPEELLAHSSFLNAVSYKLVFDKSTAEDVRQEVYLAALRRAPADDKNVKAWLATLAKNFIRMKYRSEKSRRKREEGYAAPEAVPSAEQIVQEEDLRRKIVEELLKLEEPHQSAIVLRYYRNLSMNETARTLGLSLPTLRRRMKEGLDKLRMRLDDTCKGRKNWLSVLAVPAMAHLSSKESMASEKKLSFGAIAIKTGVAAMLLLGVFLCALALLFFLQPIEDCDFIPISQFKMPVNDGVALSNPDSSNSEKQERERIEPEEEIKDQANHVNQALGRISGRVLDEAGLPLDSVSVKAVNLTEVTFKSGNWKDPLKQLASGAKNLRMGITSYKQAEKEFYNTTSRMQGSFEVQLSIPESEECLPVALVFEKTGYIHTRVEATVFQERNLSVEDVVMRPAGQVAGRVLTHDGKPLKDATIQITDGKPLWLFNDERYAFYGPEHMGGFFVGVLSDIIDLSIPKVLSQVKSDENGYFLIQGLRPGWSRLWANKFGTYYSHTGLLDIREGFTTTGLELRL